MLAFTAIIAHMVKILLNAAQQPGEFGFLQIAARGDQHQQAIQQAKRIAPLSAVIAMAQTGQKQHPRPGLFTECYHQARPAPVYQAVGEDAHHLAVGIGESGLGFLLFKHPLFANRLMTHVLFDKIDKFRQQPG